MTEREDMVRPLDGKIATGGVFGSALARRYLWGHHRSCDCRSAVSARGRISSLLAAALVAAGCSGAGTGHFGVDGGDPDAGLGTIEPAPNPATVDDDAGTVKPLPLSTVRNPAAIGHPARGTVVRISDVVVTGVKRAGTSKFFLVQDPSVAAFGGIAIFVGVGEPSVTVGDVVNITGVYTSFRGLDQIDVTAGSVLRTGAATPPVPVVVPPSALNDSGARAEELESMLVEVRNVIATTATGSNLDFTVERALSPEGTLVVTSFVANDVGPSPFVATAGQRFSSIVGYGYVVGPAQGPFQRKLAPRSAADVRP